MASAILSAFLPISSANGHEPAAGFSLRVESQAGLPLRTFQSNAGRWVLGRYGQAYRVRIHNPTPHRVEAVLSIDGRDAISGRPGDYVRQRGYVLAPYGSVVVSGFRQSLSHVAQFRFTDPGNSYSARMGTQENVGIIGVAFFRERAAERKPQPRRGRPSAKHRESRADSSNGRRHEPSAPRPAPESEGSNLGTEYGSSQYSPVNEVYFQREQPSHPQQIVTLRYDDAAGLRARGILVDPPHFANPPPPDPFPENRFAPPPP